ncbi:hypothetical protein [Methylotuvimicrobium sp.]|uniref:hypothetical protein n=1 Tax=Methylotuvimicrobium sp. TaxID=2822413 RepID=UPI003D64ECFA
MKNSFFLVIPAQQNIPERLRIFEEKALKHWLDELPVANPGLSTRLIYDFLKEFNSLAMSAQTRLDALEILSFRVSSVEEYLRFRLMQEGFPKEPDEHKIFNVLIAIEKEFTLGYWIVVKELTRRSLGWFQGKSAPLSIQRAIRGLSNIVVSYYLMNFPVPDWVWIDIHSLYRLSVKIKKDSTNVPKSHLEPGQGLSVGDCYRQILLLCLAEPSGLMQKEVLQVYNFIEQHSAHLVIGHSPFETQPHQCIILTDEDQGPHFISESAPPSDSSVLYLGFNKLIKVLQNKSRFVSKEQARFSSLMLVKDGDGLLPAELLDYLISRWTGIEFHGVPVFGDRLERYFCIGLEACHDLLSGDPANKLGEDEMLAESASERSLACHFNKAGMISIGSLIGFRKKNSPISKRSLGVVNKITSVKADGKIGFEIQLLANQVFAVSYKSYTRNETDELPQKALIYGVKSQESEKSFIILESFNLKDGDLIRMAMNNETFPIILRDRKNIGLGYWQFECRRVEELSAQKTETKKGYDFI